MQMLSRKVGSQTLEAVPASGDHIDDWERTGEIHYCDGSELTKGTPQRRQALRQQIPRIPLLPAAAFFR
jgi:hypothetical protein